MECHSSQAVCKNSRPASSTLTRDVGSSVRLCELSNGDVQVIQSHGSSSRLSDCNDAGSAADSCPKFFASHLSFQSVPSFESIASMSSLPHSCTREALQQLGGAHFHVDELMLDAKGDLEEQCNCLSFFSRSAVQLAMRLKKICNVLLCGCIGG